MVDTEQFRSPSLEGRRDPGMAREDMEGRAGGIEPEDRLLLGQAILSALLGFGERFLDSVGRDR
jgi:hypothetical protein